MNKSNYRADIDGLRAVAVLSVIFYHVGFELVSGGFVGVDVFFVISGFLITGLIKKEVEKNQSFSFSNFYIRRARRLFPALIFTLIFCLIFAFLLFTPQYLERFGLSLISVIFSVSNIFFWSESGYFDAESSVKPLLHTWSLSVEEQFYLIWPLLFVFFQRKGITYSVPFILTVVGFISLYLNLLFMESADDLSSVLPKMAKDWFSDPHASIFYLTPFRVFEFSIGGLMVWIIHQQPKNSLWLEPIFLIGFLLIGYSVFVFNENTIFPSYNALIPCIGAALLIYSGTAKYSGRLLNNRVFVDIGLISYSLYLIHWPLIVFWSYYTSSDFSNIEKWSICVLSVGVAFLMYRFIEQPFRYPSADEKKTNNKAFVIVAIGLSAVTILPAYSIWENEGWNWRYKNTANINLELNASTWDLFNRYSGRIPPEDTKEKRVLFVGDSQAADYLNVYVSSKLNRKHFVSTKRIAVHCGALYIEENQRSSYYKNNATITRTKRNWEKRCPEYQSSFFEFIKQNNFDEIVLASRWFDFHTPYFEQTIKKIKKITNASLVVVGNKKLMWPVKRINEGSSSQIAQKCFNTNKCNKISQINYFAAQYFNDSIIIEISRKWENLSRVLDFKYINMQKVICNNKIKSCLVYSNDGQPIYYDSAHFTNQGYKVIAELLFKEK